MAKMAPVTLPPGGVAGLKPGEHNAKSLYDDHRFLILGTGVLGLALMSSSSGVAEQQASRTGEPERPTHATNARRGQLRRHDGDQRAGPNTGSEVTEYLPGEQYVLEVAIGGSSPRFGMQATAVDAAGGNAGTFSNPSSNTQLEDVAGRHIFEPIPPRRSTPSRWTGRPLPRVGT